MVRLLLHTLTKKFLSKSDLSPYLHFGNLSPQRAILEAKKVPHSLPRQTDVSYIHNSTEDPQSRATMRFLKVFDSSFSSSIYSHGVFFSLNHRSCDTSRTIRQLLLPRKLIAFPKPAPYFSSSLSYQNDNYDAFDGFPGWAKETLTQHSRDKREHVYTYEQFEAADTHDGARNLACPPKDKDLHVF